MSDTALLPKSPILETRRLILRSFREDDAETVVSILRSPLCAETYLLPDYPTPEDALPLWNRLRDLSADERALTDFRELCFFLLAGVVLAYAYELAPGKKK